MLSVEKVYDELYGMIEDLKKKIAAISSGDEVTITPALESGTKIADYTIGEEAGTLYTPTIPSGLYPFIVDDTDEHVIGTDGSGTEIYCKRVNITALPSTTFSYVAYPHGIANISKILAYFGFIDFSSGIVANTTYLQFSNAGLNAIGSVYAHVDDTNINIQVGTDRSTSGAHFIILYTKTPPEPEAKKTTKKK